MQVNRGPEIHVVVDIETTGPITGIHSMIELAAVVIDHKNGEQNKMCFNFFQGSLQGWPVEGGSGRPIWIWEHSTFDWWHHIDRVGMLKDIEKEAQHPEEVMREFREYLKQWDNPVLVSFGADIPFIAHYWWKIFEQRPPFGFIGIDGKSYAMAALGCDYRYTSNSAMRRYWPQFFRDDLPHTHRALDDAKEQAMLFYGLQQQLGQNYVNPPKPAR